MNIKKKAKEIGGNITGRRESREGEDEEEEARAA
jgi:hypothetical protein